MKGLKQKSTTVKHKTKISFARHANENRYEMRSGIRHARYNARDA